VVIRNLITRGNLRMPVPPGMAAQQDKIHRHVARRLDVEPEDIAWPARITVPQE